QQPLGMHRAHRRKIGFVEGQQQGVLVNVQQMLVGSHQQGDFRQRRFGQNQTVVKFIFRQQALPEQAARELLANGFRCRVQVKGTDAPLQQVGQGRPRQFPFRRAVAVGKNEVQFVCRCRRQNQGVAEVFVGGEIEDEVSVERELLLLRRHRSSSLPR